MTKFKKLMALAAVSMLGIQLMGVGAALAVPPVGTDSDCDFGSDSLEITLGLEGTGGSKGDVDIWIDGTKLYCDSDKTDDSQAVSTIDSITVEMDDDDSDGELTILLEDGGAGGTGDLAEWPKFDTFDLDVTTEVFVDGSGVDSGVGTSSANNFRVVVGAKSLSFAGTTATSNAVAYDITGGNGDDTIDASKSAAKITAAGGPGDDLIKGGSKNDDLTGDGGGDVVYGNGGNDVVTGDDDEDDECWGGDGNDDLLDCQTVAPGAGDDYVDDTASAIAVVYADLTAGIEWTFGETDGAAGDDTFKDPSLIYAVLGSQGDDVIADNGYVSAQGGDDVVKSGGDAKGGAGDDLIIALDYINGDSDDGSAVTGNTFYGNAGSDVLKGKGDNDELRGGPGKDQAWGGAGTGDYCNAEITNRCEIGKV